MHYYRFNIPDWNLGTSHLTLEEEAIYFRLINYYYDTERPISTDLRQVARRLELTSYMDELEQILNEFFVLKGDSWIHVRCEEILKNYRKTSKKNKENGMKGGRPKQGGPLSITEDEPSGLPVASQEKPNNNLNQEPLTTNQTTSADKKSARRKYHYSDADMQIAAFIYTGIQTLNPDAKYPRMKSWANVVRLMVEQDKHTHQEIDDLFTWANQDDFWQTNILSPGKLRKQWDQLTIKRRSKMNGMTLRLNLPQSDEALADWAKKNGLKKPRPGESGWQYRDRLRAEINERDQI